MTEKGKLKLIIQFESDDNADSFGKFCKALIDGGFEPLVRQIEQELLAEVKRQKLPIADEIEAVVAS